MPAPWQPGQPIEGKLHDRFIPEQGGRYRGLHRPVPRASALAAVHSHRATGRPFGNRLAHRRHGRADGGVVVHRSHPDSRHLAAADPADSGAGHRHTGKSHCALRQPHHLPVPGWLPAGSGDAALEPAQAHRAGHSAGDGQRAESADRRLHDRHSVHQHVGQQHSHQHHDAADRPVGDRFAGCRQRQARWRALRRGLATRHRLCRQCRRHRHADRHAAQCLARRLSAREL